MDNKAPAAQSESRKVTRRLIHLPRRISWLRGGLRDGVIGVIAASAAGISAVAGLAHLPWSLILFLCAEIGALSIFVTHAATANTAQLSARYWCISFMLSLILPAGAFGYHAWFDPARVQHRVSLIANGTEVNVGYLYGEPGGQPQILETGPLGQNGFIGGQSCEFECIVTISDGEQWLRFPRGSRVWWAPRKFFHSPVGVTPEEIRRC